MRLTQTQIDRMDLGEIVDHLETVIEETAMVKPRLVSLLVSSVDIALEPTEEGEEDEAQVNANIVRTEADS